jgi:hypothetical protein
VGRDYLCQAMKSKAQGDHPSLSIGVADFGGPSLSS